MINKTIEKLKKDKNLIVSLSCVAVAGGLTLLLNMGGDNETVKEEPQTADTYIPYGYVLVPVEISNHEALHSLLGRHGVVDLFLPPTEKKKRPQRLGRQVKLLRAPLNPRKFAVLVPENSSGRFVHADRPLFAVVKNPLQKSVVKQVEEKIKKRKIYFVDDD